MNGLKYECIDIKKNIFLPILHIQTILLESIDKLQKLANLPPGTQDVRIVTLTANKDILVQFGWTFAAIGIATDEKNFNFWQQFVDNKKINKTLAQKEMGDYLRKSVIIAIHFHIDNMFRSLLTEIDDVPKGQGFRTYAGRLRERTNSSNEDFNKIMALTYMRNCFHNNGIHKGKELRIKLGNDQVSFIPNQDIDYSIGRVFNVLKAAIPVVCNWLFKPPLSDLKHIIEDSGALASSN